MEGPSLVILSEELREFVGRTIDDVTGNSKQDIERIKGNKILSIRSWGKHLLIELAGFSIRVHFLMFGSYRINEQKENRIPRLSLIIGEEEINFYSCSIQFIEQPLNKVYDWKLDLMSPLWDERLVTKKVKVEKGRMICDVLMDQEIFGGLGNIIKNEVLFNTYLHPEAIVEDLPLKKIKEVVKEARDYSFRFYEWKKVYELRKHWLIYKKRKCPRCNVPVQIRKTGKGDRRSYFCELCQRKYEDKPT
jgi:endonuclease VIII